MSIDTPEKDSFLQELFRTSDGDSGRTVSMYQVGDSLGLSKAEVSALSEDLIIDGYLELQTLSGGVSITPEGLAAIGVAGAGNSPELPRLSGERIATADDLQLLAGVVGNVKQCTFGENIRFSQLDELLIDLKTLEVQLLSTKPKTAIIKAVLSSMVDNLKKFDTSESIAILYTELEALISES